jgi:orotidine-5'-phosphate decarboxylase
MHGTDAPALSSKAIPVRDRLIFALDVASTEEARALVGHLGESVSFYKIGLEFFMAGGYFEFLSWLHDRGKKAFVDLKFFDVPNTVGSAVRALRRQPASFATVHGNDAILKAAVAEKGDLKILAVTALTSLDNGDLQSLGFAVDVSTLVLSRARRALAIGCDGVVSSGLEVESIRNELGEKLLIVVPGIRPVANMDDQKRTIDVEEAFRRGADYIVVGRPIRAAPDPAKAAEAIQHRIAALFA